jgi:hypothetical protein
MILESDDTAIAEIEKALAAIKEQEMKANVKREGDRVWIEGVPNAEIPHINRRWDALLEGVALLLRHRGEDVDQGRLMAISGDAFSLCHGTHWEGRTALSVPTDTMTNVGRAFGYDSSWVGPTFSWNISKRTDEEKRAAREEFIAAVRAEVDVGHPVLMGGAKEMCGLWRVVVGLDTQAGLVCQNGGAEGYDWTELVDKKTAKIGYWDMQVRGPLIDGLFGGWVANGAFVLGEKKRAVPPRERAITVLRRATEVHRAKPFSTTDYGAVTYHFGVAAYEEWALDLEALELQKDLEGANRRKGDFYDLNMMRHQVNQIVRGRVAAADYCESSARVLPAGAEHLQTAARLFRDESATARTAFAPFLSKSGFMKGEGRKPWRTCELSPEAVAWLGDPAKCREGAGVIRQMLKKERAAIAEIEKALAAMGEGAKPDGAL